MTATRKMWSTCCNAHVAIKSMSVVRRLNFARDLTSINRIFGPTSKSISVVICIRVNLFHRQAFFSHFFEQGHRGELSVKISIIDGAGNVYALRRKELFWQYKLGVFSPKGLNERVADIELDLFACGSA